MRLAAIDIGTNSIHVVVAQASGHGGFDVLDREREVVQIGRGSFGSGRLRADAVDRTVEALSRMIALAKSQGAERNVCTATAAVRVAKNGGDFVRAARAATGITPRVIPPREEGRLIWLAVQSALHLGPEPALLFDIGGGSLQMVGATRDRLQKVVSAPLGALRLAELFPLGDPPAPEAITALRRHIRKTAREGLEAMLALAPERVVGSSGSIHALAHVARWMEGRPPIEHLNGHVLSRKSLERAARRLAEMPLAERQHVPGIDEPRAEILIHGALVLSHLLEECGADGLMMSDFGVREGLIADYIARHAKEIERLDPIDDLRLRSVYRLLARFRGDETHARHVTDLSLALFDGLRREHRLDDDARRLLSYASLVHDIGSVIGHEDHTEHSSYIVKHGNLRGLSAEEVEIVATVARFHGKARPRKSDKAFRSLSREARRIVRWLAAILRIAEALDRSQYQLVRGVRLVMGKGTVTIRAAAREDARLEIWAARQRTRLLGRLLGRRVRVALEAPQVPAQRHADARTSSAPQPARRAGPRAAPTARPPARPAPAPSSAARSQRATPRARRGRAPSPEPAAASATPRRARGRAPGRARAGTPRRSAPS